MSIENWQPASEPSTVNIQDLQLEEFIALGHEDEVESHTQNLTPEQIKKLHLSIKQTRQFWMQAAKEISTQELHHLIRFFTLAEEHNSELQCGNDSPVIAFNKTLKKRDRALDKNFLLWIKEHSSNRFLPNGSIL